VKLGEGVSIGAGCVVGDGVSDRQGQLPLPRGGRLHGCTLGERVIVHSGAVIGADGFGLAQDEAGRWSRFRRSARYASATTSRSAPTPPSTAARSTTP
jgi:UDP-3-O-[3-hydroxymyristoyl] glucosamine N-acyltransferase